VEWEGNGVLELVEDMLPKESEQPKQDVQQVQLPVEPKTLLPESSSDEDSAGSGDEYVDEDAKAGASGRAKKKVRKTIHPQPKSILNDYPLFQNRRQVESSEEGSDSDASGAVRKPKTSTKRKANPPSGPSSKRQKTVTEVQTAEEDPVRKYCAGKLKTILSNIFQKQRPYVKPDGPEEDDEAEEEHKRKNEARANRFTEELEQALFENFAEIIPGKAIRSAAAKYK
jgi:hypothetical protein